MGEIIKFSGVVEELSKGETPRILVAKIASRDGRYRATVDVHEELKVFDEGDEVEVVISTDKPSFKHGEDFVGKGTLYVYRPVSEGTVKLQASIGGFQVIVVGVESDMPRDLSVPLDVYIKLSKLKG